MITKIIATFPCGGKIIRTRPEWKLRLGRWLKLKPRGSRPHSIQVFGANFDEEDKREIFTDLMNTLHPIHGQLTINGQYVTAEDLWPKN